MMNMDVHLMQERLKQDPVYVEMFAAAGYGELKQTAPYMHNGTVATLEEVVTFYNRGGGADANKDPRLKPLGLSREEQADLVAFLEALSGDPLTGPEHVWTEKIPANYQAIENRRDVRN